MQVFWHCGSLRFEPQTIAEYQALEVLSASIVLAKPLERIQGLPSGSTSDLGELLSRYSEAIDNTGVINHQINPSCFSGEGSNQQPIISIDVPLKIVSDGFSARRVL